MSARSSDRERALKEWVERNLPVGPEADRSASSLQRISGDASFRSYYRARVGERSWVAVDAPPAEEDSRPFIEIADILGRYGLNVPRVFAQDLAAGFMLVSDLGDDLYLHRIEKGADSESLYSDAIDALLRMQSIPPQPGRLPPYDRSLLLMEMSLFPDWMVTRQLGLDLAAAERAQLDELFETLIASAIEQPQVLVHRDYHSRNLLVTADNNPGIVDFQDAVIGALSYDLVSLLRDCYIEWPEAFVERWTDEFLRRRAAIGHLPDVDPERFMRWFDLMGLQRHIKVAGIFCRLHIRDGKALYLRDIPLVMRYILRVASRYPEFAPFVDWVCARVLPPMAARADLFGPLEGRLGPWL